ncbi:hypothetical protein [Thiomicrospira sp.]|uniref:hypothetical protein n=1 Tax=Thiomicrospira sp. TaxID=935 RepID=UPI002F9292C4
MKWFDEKMLEKINNGFQEFRDIELQVLEELGGCPPTQGSWKSFNMLHEIETCYSVGAYVASFILTLAAIEASFNASYQKKKGNLKGLIEKSGYGIELDELRQIRNDIIHDQDIGKIASCFDESMKLDMKENCQKAFRLMHRIYYQPTKVV